MGKKKPKPKLGTQKSKLQEVAGIVFIFSGAFLLLSLITYSSLDPSFLHYTRRLPSNYAGHLGANLSEALLQSIGFSSFLFCIQALFLGLKLIHKMPVVTTITVVIWKLLSVLLLSTFLSLHFGSVTYGGTLIFIGGFVGKTLSTVLVKGLNLWGATLVSLCSFLVALVFSTSFSMASVLRTISFITQTWARWSWGIAKQIATHSERKKVEKIIAEKLSPKTDFVKPAEPVIAVKTTLDISTEEVKKPVSPEPKKTPSTPPQSEPVSTETKFALPPLDLLKEIPAKHTEIDRSRLIENSKILEQKLIDFGIDGAVTAVRPGPVITMYEFKPGPGVKISQIAALADDLSLALSAQSVRIVAPIPGKSVVGIEIPNEEREKVSLREVFATPEFQNSCEGIPLAIGKDISGTPVTADLARMPHLLIAGAPGAGKSVFINSLICSLLYKFTPHDLRLIMVDPKQLELNLYENIPHLLLPIVDDPKNASTALKWAVVEMEKRYKMMAKAGVRHIAGFNEKLEKEGSNERIPVILVIIDEFADLMMVAPKDIETNVARLAQKARAAGIHLVIATQRPSVDVITGLIKANLPSRVSFKVASKVDSRTILDGSGAEKLLGMGDMLFIPPGISKLVRLHGAFVTEEEIERLCSHWKEQASPVYREEILIDPDEQEKDSEIPDGAQDPLYQEAISIIREMGQASASMLQRRLKVGYNRAARMVEAMEVQGIVGPADGAKPREVLL